MTFNLSGKTVWIAGHGGFVGRALCERLASEGCEILTVSRAELDLRRQSDTEAWLAANKPDAVILAAATVGGIEANRTRPAEFLYDNLAIELSVIEGAYKAGCSKLMMLGAACVYPRMAEQPIVEEALMTGPLEPTNEWYSIAKIAGMKMVEAYRQQYGFEAIQVVPANLYGPGDHFDAERSHVCGALMAKIHRAKLKGEATIEVWGTGSPQREFLYIDDMADGLVFLMQHYSDGAPINLSGGTDVSIRELGELLADIIGWSGSFEYDTSRPDGMPRKALNGQRVASLGWQPKIDLREGLSLTYNWFLEHAPEAQSQG
jgi:GDP-L-fucose synthase